MSRLIAEQQTIHEIDNPAAIMPGQAQDFLESRPGGSRKGSAPRSGRCFSDMRAELPTYAPRTDRFEPRKGDRPNRSVDDVSFTPNETYQGPPEMVTFSSKKKGPELLGARH